MIFFLISSTENKRLSELEIELENLKMEREKLKIKLQCLRKWKNSEVVEQLTLKWLRIRCEKLKVVRIHILIIHHMSGLTVYRSTYRDSQTPF